MNQPKLNSIHHAAIICSDYTRSKRFYTELLGLSVIDENYRVERDSYKLDLALPDGSQVELFSMPGAPKRLSYPEAQGLRHLAFAVTNIDTWVEWFQENQVGHEPVRVDPYTGKRFLFFADPDELPLELYEQI